MKKFFKAKNDAMFKAIFCNDNNRDLLKRLLEEVTGKQLEVIDIKASELLKNKVFVKGKTLDVLVKTNDGEANIEINSYSDSTLHRRNMAYICSRYSNSINVGDTYDEMPNFIQINLSTMHNNIPYDIYKLKGEINGNLFVDNFTIYEFNLPIIKRKCYNKYKLLALLDADKDELNKLCVGDKLMEKFKSEVNKLNDDEEFFKLMTDEEENEMLKNTYIHYGYKDGINDGIKEGEENKSKKIALNMLKKNMDINLISELTNLSTSEIKNLKNSLQD